MVYHELKITLFVMALLHKFSANHACIVIRTGPAVARRARLSRIRISRMTHALLPVAGPVYDGGSLYCVQAYRFPQKKVTLWLRANQGSVV